MITDSIQSCITAINDNVAARNQKARESEYQMTLGLLNSSCSKLLTVLETITAIEENRISQDSLLSRTLKEELLVKLDQCGQGLSTSMLSRETVQALNSNINQLQSEVSSSWHVCAPQYADGIAGYLGIIRGLAENPADVDTMKTNISTYTAGSPSAGVAKKLVSEVTKARSLISHFALKPEIEAFLKKVSDRKATILDLTPEIREWLESQNLTGKLKISF